MSWINVLDKLPPLGENVLLYVEGMVIQGCLPDDAIKNNYTQWEFVTLGTHGCGCCGHDDDKVTFWQHLPKEPDSNIKSNNNEGVWVGRNNTVQQWLDDNKNNLLYGEDEQDKAATMATKEKPPKKATPKRSRKRKVK